MYYGEWRIENTLWRVLKVRGGMENREYIMENAEGIGRKNEKGRDGYKVG